MVNVPENYGGNIWSLDDLCKIQVKLNNKIARIISDHGKEFENDNVEEFCVENRTSHNFLDLRIPK